MNKNLGEILRIPPGSENQADREDALRGFYEFYCERVQEGKAEFDDIMKILEEVAEELVASGEIGKNIRILSRIKAPESLLNKMKLAIEKAKLEEEAGKNISDNTKGTYDICGVTILCENQAELEKVLAELKRKYVEIEEETRRNSAGYQATHFRIPIRKFNNLKVECHLQTIEQDKKNYPHLYYKVSQKNGNKKLTPEEELEVNEEIQRQYRRGELEGIILSNGKKSRVPQMWEARLDGNGKMVRKELTEYEALRLAYYPALEGINEKDR